MSKYVKSGATIIFDGCDAAEGIEGKELMKEFGRIFFEDKSGILRGNTCKAFSGAGAETGICDPVEFRYPEMEKYYTPEELVKEAFGNL